MDLASTDVAARGRVVADLAEYKRQLNSLLGIKQRAASVLAISDLILDVFQFVGRKEPDTLQIVSVRFNAIVEKKLALVCLRQLEFASMSRCSAQRQFVLIMREVGAKKMTRLPTGVDNEGAATNALVNACRSSSVDSLQLYGKIPMNKDFFDSLALCAPSIFVKNFCLGKRTLDEGVEHEDVLRALQTFAELKAVTTEVGMHPRDKRNENKEREKANLQGCLIRTCFKEGVTLVRDELLLNINVVVESALKEFCFGACDERYAERDRFLSVELSESPKSDFLQRWIERAEATDCRHKLTLDISIWRGLTSQDTAALDGYKHDHHVQWETRFGSVSGRNWAATCSDYGHGYVGSKRITFKINH